MINNTRILYSQFRSTSPMMMGVIRMTPVIQKTKGSSSLSSSLSSLQQPQQSKYSPSNTIYHARSFFNMFSNRPSIKAPPKESSSSLLSTISSSSVINSNISMRKIHVAPAPLLLGLQEKMHQLDKEYKENPEKFHKDLYGEQQVDDKPPSSIPVYILIALWFLASIIIEETETDSFWDLFSSLVANKHETMKEATKPPSTSSLNTITKDTDIYPYIFFYIFFVNILCKILNNYLHF